MSTNKINIAIDGFSSCGKSTLAQQLAAQLGYIHVDSGAMYRAVTLYFLQNNINTESSQTIEEALDKIHLEFNNIKGINTSFLNGKDVNLAIRSKPVNDHVSDIAKFQAVRKRMVSLQYSMASQKGVVMDGRDIGTVVLPNAELKLFLTADIDIRTKRRMLEINNGGKNVTFEEVQRNLLRRDQIDSTREFSPLVKAKDAITIDNSYLNEQEQLEKVLNIIKDVFPHVHIR